MIIIAEKPWSYILFDDGNGWVLTFLIGGIVEVDVSIRLLLNEVESIKKNPDFINTFITDVKKEREKFSHREIIPPIWPPN